MGKNRLREETEKSIKIRINTELYGAKPNKLDGNKCWRTHRNGEADNRSYFFGISDKSLFYLPLAHSQRSIGKFVFFPVPILLSDFSQNTKLEKNISHSHNTPNKLTTFPDPIWLFFAVFQYTAMLYGRKHTFLCHELSVDFLGPNYVSRICNPPTVHVKFSVSIFFYAVIYV